MSAEDNRLSEKLEAARERASEWVAKHDLGLSEADQEAFLDWLAEDPVHSELFEEQLEMWQSFDMLEQWRPRHSEIPNPDLLALPPKKRAWRRGVAFGAMAASLLLALGVVWFQNVSREAEVPVEYLADGDFAKGFERHELQDGSQVQLNRGSQVSIHFKRDQRLVKLLSGQAHFSVAKDPERPFVVEVDGLHVRAIGTAFCVEKQNGKVEVLVTEGHVQCESEVGHSSRSFVSPQQRRAFDLFAGQRSFIDLDKRGAEPVIENVSFEQIENELAWKERILEFNGAPLAKVIHEFNLRNEMQIYIVDSDLRDRRITAAIRPDNVEGFIELLEAALGVRVIKTAESEIYLQG